MDLHNGLPDALCIAISKYVNDKIGQIPVSEAARKVGDELLGKLLEDPQVQSYLLKRMKKLKLHPALSALASSAPEPRQEERV
jgi:hypothetical protein